MQVVTRPSWNFQSKISSNNIKVANSDVTVTYSLNRKDNALLVILPNNGKSVESTKTGRYTIHFNGNKKISSIEISLSVFDGYCPDPNSIHLDYDSSNNIVGIYFTQFHNGTVFSDISTRIPGFCTISDVEGYHPGRLIKLEICESLIV